MTQLIKCFYHNPENSSYSWEVKQDKSTNKWTLHSVVTNDDGMVFINSCGEFDSCFDAFKAMFIVEKMEENHE